MKRCLLIFIAILVIIGFSPASAEGQSISILVDGLPVISESPPVIQEGRALVPFRAVAERLKAEVTWNPDLRKVTATQGGNTIELRIGSRTAFRNGGPVLLDTPPMIIQGRTLIPLRFFAEALGCQVAWDGLTYEISIASPPQAMSCIGFYALGDSRTSSWTSVFGRPYPEVGGGAADIISDLALGWYSVDAQGNLLTRSRTGWQRPDSWEDVLDTAESLDIKTEMVVHVTEADHTITTMMSDNSAVEQFVSAALAESQTYDGVNLDFEGLGLGGDPSADRQLFTGLVSQLYSALRPAGKTLTLTLHAPNSSYKGYDYQALGQVCDQIIIMAYDYGPSPEPDAMVIQAVETAVRLAPADKLLLGVSLPSETPESLVTRIGIAKKYDLKGLALWRLGLISEPAWQSIRAGILARDS